MTKRKPPLAAELTDEQRAEIVRRFAAYKDRGYLDERCYSLISAELRMDEGTVRLVVYRDREGKA